MKNITFLSALLATTILAGNALADIDFTEYNSSCGSRYRCYEDDSGNIIATDFPEGPSPYTSYYYTSTYDKVSKNVIESRNQYIYRGDTTPATDAVTKYTYDDLGRKIESTRMEYSYMYGMIDNLGGYSKTFYHYDSDDATNYSFSDTINISGATSNSGGSSIDIMYNNQNIRIKNAVALTNENIEEVKKLVNESDFDKVLAYTGGQIDYYQTMDPNKMGFPSIIKTNDRGFSYLPIEYDDFSEGYTEVYEIPEMFVQNEDGSISVYDISAATADLSREELNAFIQNADPKDIAGATLKGKYDSVVQYMLHGVLGYNASGSDDDASALAEKYHGTPLLYGKKIYTVEEAMEATKDGTKFHVGLTYK